MTSPLLLTGKTIVVTRPRDQADALITGIRQEGGEAYCFPLLEISPCPDSTWLSEAENHLANATLAIFVSVNAVRYAMPSLREIWPQHLDAAATGTGTAEALAVAGISRCLLPIESFDSEGLLALPELAADRIAGREILIFKGEGGRELLATTLTERGAKVFPISVYQRHPPKEGQDEFLARLVACRFDAITISSSEALRHLQQLAEERPETLPSLYRLPLFTSHPRIAAYAKESGFIHVICADAGDTGLLTGLSAYNWQSMNGKSSPPLLPTLPPPRQDGRRPFWLNPWFWFALILIVCLLWQWNESRSLIQNARQETARRLTESEDAQRKSLAQISDGLQEVAELQRKEAQLDTRLSALEEQAAALEGLYQEASASRDEALLIEIEQNIQTAQQQLQLAGNVEAAILALQAADNRLQNRDARFLPLRRALANDLGKLQATPFIDIAGMSLRLESVITEIDRLPLALDITPENMAQKPAKPETDAPDENAAPQQSKWRDLFADVWHEIRGLVRIQRLDRQTPELVSPEQGLILRENLKLRLLNARLALLMRDSWTYKNELTRAEERLAHYFNPDVRATQAARATLSQLAKTEINTVMPTLNESATAAQKLRNETR
jgi:uncharacterized protein HemX/uroporphyrinogen-III synthase